MLIETIIKETLETIIIQEKLLNKAFIFNVTKVK